MSKKSKKKSNPIAKLFSKGVNKPRIISNKKKDTKKYEDNDSVYVFFGDED